MKCIATGIKSLARHFVPDLESFCGSRDSLGVRFLSDMAIPITKSIWEASRTCIWSVWKTTKVKEVANPQLESPLAQLARKENFTIRRYKIQIFGTFPQKHK